MQKIFFLQELIDIFQTVASYPKGEKKKKTIKYHYVYRITCTHPHFQWGPKYYYGVRTSSVEPHLDPYLSSSKPLKGLIKIYGQSFFKKKIVRVFGTREQALAKEVYLHRYFNVKDHPLFFNQANQTGLGFDCRHWSGIPKTGEQREALSRALLGKPKDWGEGSRERISQYQRKRAAQEEYQAIREYLKGEAIARNRKQATCPHCGRTGGLVAMKRWHFDNCKTLTRKGPHVFERQLQQLRQNNATGVECPHCKKIGAKPAMMRWHFEKCSKKE